MHSPTHLVDVPRSTTVSPHTRARPATAARTTSSGGAGPRLAVEPSRTAGEQVGGRGVDAGEHRDEVAERALELLGQLGAGTLLRREVRARAIEPEERDLHVGRGDDLDPGQGLPRRVDDPGDVVWRHAAQPEPSALGMSHGFS